MWDTSAGFYKDDETFWKPFQRNWGFFKLIWGFNKNDEAFVKVSILFEDFSYRLANLWNPNEKGQLIPNLKIYQIPRKFDSP
jgi:hypothetical protein